MKLTKRQAYAMGLDLSIVSKMKNKKHIGHNTYLSEVAPKKHGVFTGFPMFDECLPKNGIPFNSVITIFGPYSSGKSYFLYKIKTANNITLPIDINSGWNSEVLNIYPAFSTIDTFSSSKSSKDVANIKRINSVTGAISFVTIHTGYAQIKNPSEIPSDILNNSEVIVSLRLIDNDNTVAYVLKNDFGPLCVFTISGDYNI